MIDRTEDMYRRRRQGKEADRERKLRGNSGRDGYFAGKTERKRGIGRKDRQTGRQNDRHGLGNNGEENREKDTKQGDEITRFWEV